MKLLDAENCLCCVVPKYALHRWIPKRNNLVYLFKDDIICFEKVIHVWVRVKLFQIAAGNMLPIDNFLFDLYEIFQDVVEVSFLPDEEAYDETVVARDSFWLC